MGVPPPGVFGRCGLVYFLFWGTRTEGPEQHAHGGSGCVRGLVSAVRQGPQLDLSDTPVAGLVAPHPGGLWKPTPA